MGKQQGSNVEDSYLENIGLTKSHKGWEKDTKNINNDDLSKWKKDILDNYEFIHNNVGETKIIDKFFKTIKEEKRSERCFDLVVDTGSLKQLSGNDKGDENKKNEKKKIIIKLVKPDGNEINNGTTEYVVIKEKIINKRRKKKKNILIILIIMIILYIIIKLLIG